MLRKIEELADGLSQDELDAVESALDQRLQMNEHDRVFQPVEGMSTMKTAAMTTRTPIRTPPQLPQWLRPSQLAETTHALAEVGKSSKSAVAHNGGHFDSRTLFYTTSDTYKKLLVGRSDSLV